MLTVLERKHGKLPDLCKVIPDFYGITSCEERYTLSIEVFIRRVEEATCTADWTDIKRIMVATRHIKGRALTAVNAFRPSITWQAFSQDLYDRFAESSANLRMALFSFKPKRKKGEMFSEFADRVWAELDSFCPGGCMSTEEKRGYTLQILKDNLPEEVHPLLCSTRPITRIIVKLREQLRVLKKYKLSENDIDNELAAVASTKKEETGNKEEKQQTNTVAYVGARNGDRNNFRNRQLRRSDNNNNYNKSYSSYNNRRPTNTNTGMVCFRCNKPGHIRRDCRVKIQNQGSFKKKAQLNSRPQQRQQKQQVAAVDRVQISPHRKVDGRGSWPENAIDYAWN